MDKEYIKVNLSMEQVLDHYQVRHRAGKRILITCPFHEDHSPSLSVNMESNLFKCYGCGAKGDVISFVMKEEGLQFRDACDFIMRVFFSGVNPPVNPEKKREKTKVVESRSFLVTEQDKAIYSRIYELSGLSAKGRAYLHKRGFADEVINKFGLRSVPSPEQLNDILKNEFSFLDLKSSGIINSSNNYIFYKPGILIPYHQKSEITYFELRFFEPDEGPKYIGLVGKIKQIFTGNITGNVIQVFEGVFDALSFYMLFNDENIMACGGLNGMEEDKIRLFLQEVYGRGDQELIYHFDNDGPGHIKAHAARAAGKRVFELADWCKENGMKKTPFSDWNEALVSNRCSVIGDR